MAGPYVRAIQAGVRALVPNEEQVPLFEVLSHLEALDPAHTFDLFAPFLVDPVTGLPDYTWMERVVSELAVLGPVGDMDWDPEEIQRAQKVDPSLGQRLRSRQWLSVQASRLLTLPSSRLRLRYRSRSHREKMLLQFDKIVPGQGWMRIQMDVDGVAGWGKGLWVETDDGHLRPADALLHLCSRHSRTPITLLHHALEQHLEAWIPTISRGNIGPFWFPGGPNVNAPEVFDGALTLHMSIERLGTDSAKNAHRDPWLAPVKNEAIPAGYALFRERRFAASSTHIERINKWAFNQGCATIVVPIEPR